MKDIKPGLERLLKKYLPVIGITSLEVPIHEGLHAGLAEILPHIGCEGIVLNESHWYSGIFKYLTLGYYKTADLSKGLGGYAEINHTTDFLGNLGQTIVAAAPEVATMTLGFYWIKKAMDNITEKGERLYSLVCAYAGMALASSTFNYLKLSSLSPEEGQDYFNFTKGILNMFHLPGGLAPIFTFLGAAGLVSASLYLANKFSRGKPSEDFEYYSEEPEE